MGAGDSKECSKERKNAIYMVNVSTEDVYVIVKVTGEYLDVRYGGPALVTFDSPCETGPISPGQTSNNLLCDFVSRKAGSHINCVHIAKVYVLTAEKYKSYKSKCKNIFCFMRTNTPIAELPLYGASQHLLSSTGEVLEIKDEFTGMTSPRRRRANKEFGVNMQPGGHYSYGILGNGHIADHDFIYKGGDIMIGVNAESKSDYCSIVEAEIPTVPELLFRLNGLKERNKPERKTLSSAIGKVKEEWEYQYSLNNCQHFAYWCSTGVFTARTVMDGTYNSGKNTNLYFGHDGREYPRFKNLEKGSIVCRPSC